MHELHTVSEAQLACAVRNSATVVCCAVCTCLVSLRAYTARPSAGPCCTVWQTSRAAPGSGAAHRAVGPVPEVHPLAQADGDHVAGSPVHLTAVEVVAELRSVQNLSNMRLGLRVSSVRRNLSTFWNVAIPSSLSTSDTWGWHEPSFRRSAADWKLYCSVWWISHHDIS